MSGHESLPGSDESEPTERAAFDAWWARATFTNCSEWHAWQARAKLSTLESSKEGVPEAISGTELIHLWFKSEGPEGHGSAPIEMLRRFADSILAARSVELSKPSGGWNSTVVQGISPEDKKG